MKEIIELYHASTETVACPDVGRGRRDLDFGPGFYLTDVYEQAVSWACRRGRERKARALLNVYNFDKTDLTLEARCKFFPRYDEEWLRYVADCRSARPVWQAYDYVEGGVANDRVISTVSLFMQGVLPADYALERLQYLQPSNQICILSQDLVRQRLTFKECVTLTDDGQL